MELLFVHICSIKHVEILVIKNQYLVCSYDIKSIKTISLKRSNSTVLYGIAQYYFLQCGTSNRVNFKLYFLK